MDPGLLKSIVSELDSGLRAGIISRIHQPDERNVILRVFVRGREHSLLISTNPGLSRVHLTERRYPNPPRPPRFCAFLRSRIIGAKIEGMTQVQGERIVRIKLKKRAEEYTLVAELTGKSSNVILLDKDGVILDSLRYFPDKESIRAVIPGIRLAPLPRPEAIKEKKQAIKPEEGETWNRAVDRYYGALVDIEELGERKRFLLRVVKKALEKARRKLENLLGDREKAKADLNKSRTGELLLASFKRIKKGMTEVEVEDLFSQPPCVIKIPLDPAKTPQENVARYFKRAKKASTALSMLEDRLLGVEKEVEYLRVLMFECDEMECGEDAQGLSEELVELGYLKKDEAPLDDRKHGPEPIRRFTSSAGFEILCGKSGKANDLLVREYAAPHDIWLHARDVAGAHVLLKGGGKTPDQDAIAEAASFAAYYSKARGSAKAEVVYAEAKDVKKPKGAKPGMVTVREYKTIMVKADVSPYTVLA
ncbi:MAG: NFACT family protein [Deltaproteobacteria bacterium]|nr:NFACT family protein [Deltaproteobacteria bacterium]